MSTDWEHLHQIPKHVKYSKTISESKEAGFIRSDCLGWSPGWFVGRIMQNPLNGFPRRARKKEQKV